MGVFDKASLALVPDGIKDGKLYSIKPTDGSGDFTFTRGSNLAATRVDENGLIEKGRENLLLQSNQFDTTWFTVNLTATSGQIGYDGSSNAWLLHIDSTSPSARIEQTVSSTGLSAYSVYAKAGTTSFLALRNNSSTTVSWFNLSGSGSVTKGVGAIDAVITSVGNGWFRCSILFDSCTSVRFYVGNAAEYPVTAGTNIYIQDAQLEQSIVATDYIESGASTAQAGVLEDLPRIDYSGSTPSLLLEPTRTNIWIHSEYLDYSFDSVTGVTRTQNTTETLSPEGLYNATKLEGTGPWGMRQFITGTNTGTWTISCYIKAVNESSNNTFRLSVGGNNFSSNFTATEEWQRFEHTFTNGGATATGILRDASTNDADLYIYGFQVEEGSYPTSYIPTYGTAATRGADDIYKLTGVGVTGDEFSIFLELDLSDTPLVQNLGTYFQTFDASNNSQQEFRFFTSAGEQVLVPYFRQDTQYPFGTGSDPVRFDGKILFRADGGGSYTMFFGFNGSSNKEVRTGLTAYTLNKIDFISRPKTNVKQLLIFNEALSDAECITLTT